MKKQLKILFLIAVILIPVIWFTITVKNLFFRKLDLKGVNEIELSYMENHNDEEGSITVTLEQEDDNFQKIIESCSGYIYVDLHADGLDESYESGCVKIAFKGEQEYTPLYLYYIDFCYLRIGKTTDFLNIGEHEETFEFDKLMQDCGMPANLFDAVDKIELSYITDSNEEKEQDAIILEPGEDDFQKVIDVLRECYDINHDDAPKKVDVKKHLPCIRLTLTRDKKSFQLYLYYDGAYWLQKDNTHIFYYHQGDENSTGVMDVLEECGMQRIGR